MPSNRTSAQPGIAGPTLADLDVSELTAALGASDMPVRARGASREQLAAWAQQGLDRLGADAIRERAERTAYLDYGERGIGVSTPAERAELRGMWPSVRRLDAANDAAYDLRKQLAADLLRAPEIGVEHSGRPAVAVATEKDLRNAKGAREHAVKQAEAAREAGDEELARGADGLAGIMDADVRRRQAAEAERLRLAEAAAPKATVTAGLDPAAVQAERHTTIEETFSDPQATRVEIAWALNWSAEAEAAEPAASVEPEAAI